MIIRVPTGFADAIRRQRLWALSILAIVVFAASLLWVPVVGFAGIPIVSYIVIILATFRLPLLYKLDSRSISLTTPMHILSIPISLAINFWVAWPLDRVAEISHTHYLDSPAVLIRTKMNRRGFLLPVLRADAESVALFLGPSTTDTGANAFSR
jgi:hypothetical protein